MEMQSCRMIFVIAVLQGSTLRKRKMYEEFLSKVSILGKGVQCPMKMQGIVCFFCNCFCCYEYSEKLVYDFVKG